MINRCERCGDKTEHQAPYCLACKQDLASNEMFPLLLNRSASRFDKTFDYLDKVCESLCQLQLQYDDIEAEYKVRIQRHENGIDPVFLDVLNERTRQDEKWGQQNHPHGCEPSPQRLRIESKAKENCDNATGAGVLTWMHILYEEMAELFAAKSTQQAYEEAIQVAAVALAMAQSIKRNGK